MEISVQLHGWLKRKAKDSHGRVDLDLPSGSDVGQAIAALRERGLLGERLTSVIVIDGERVSSDQVLEPGDVVELYPVISGG
ncbi:MAG: MoaD/ThiS family protein [Anaerolineae bacterium]|jgi:molybdopterin converting factor small subunit